LRVKGLSGLSRFGTPSPCRGRDPCSIHGRGVIPSWHFDGVQL